MKMLFAFAILVSSLAALATPSPCQIKPEYCNPKPKPCTPTAYETYQFRHAERSAAWAF